MSRERRRKTVKRWKYDAVLILAATLLVALLPNAISAVFAKEPPLSPMADNIIVVEEEVVEVREIPLQNYDTWVGQATDHFFVSNSQRSEVRMILHCLLHREAVHGTNKGHGDGGRAGGPLQFHQPTWDAYRKLMIQEGEATEIGSRYDMEQAIWTTAWAIKDGRAMAWGPVLRYSNGSNYAACQSPSWY